MTRSLIDPELTVQEQAAVIVAAQERLLSAEELAAIDAWRHANPEHELELMLAEDLFRGDELTMALAPYADQLGTAAEPRALPVWARLRQVFGTNPVWGWGLSGSAAALAVMVLGAQLWMTAPTPASGTQDIPTEQHLAFATDRAETATHLLADGSQLVLSGDSVVELTFSEARRDVYLVSGEAYFDVAHDAERPFTVWVDAVSFQALGTAFNVDRRASSAELSVFEGRVAARLGDRNQPFGPGEGVSVSASEFTDFSFDPDGGVDWQQGWLEARRMRLEDAALELQRFSDRRILVASDVADRRVTGRFPLDGGEDTLVRIVETQNLTLETSASVILVRSRTD